MASDRSLVVCAKLLLAGLYNEPLQAKSPAMPYLSECV